MPRTFKRPDEDHPSPFGNEWNEYRIERIRYMDGLFRHEEPTDPEWIVEGMIPRGYLVLLAGRPKDGKTCLAMALAYAVSQGLPFAGMPTVKSTVLYFMCEESPVEFELAIRPFLPDGRIEGLGIAFAKIKIDSGFDLSALRMRLNAIKPGLVVIDPLLAASTQGDFGNSGRARNALSGLKTLCRELNVAAIVVHHAKERRGRASRVAENPQLAATASLNIILNWKGTTKGRIVTLEMTGRGPFANRTIRLSSDSPCAYAPFEPRGARHVSAENVNHAGTKGPTEKLEKTHSEQIPSP